jgi:hypothetical protein
MAPLRLRRDDSAVAVRDLHLQKQYEAFIYFSTALPQMTRWEDLAWNERILQLDLTVDEKSAAINLIDSLGEPWPARQEAAVPKDKAVALESIRKRLKASGESRAF